MKRMCCAAAAILMAAALMAGCQAADSPADTTVDLEAPSPAATLELPSVEPSLAAAPAETDAPAGITVTMEAFKDEGDIQIYYPQLSGLGDGAKQEALNAFFAGLAEDMDVSLAKDFPEGLEGSDLDWTWTLAENSPSVISLVERDYWNSPLSAHPSSGLSAYNIDPESGEFLRLGDMCDTGAIAADLVAADGQSGQSAYTVAAPDGTDVTAECSISSVYEMNFMMVPGLGETFDEAGLKALLDAVDYSGEEGSSPAGYSYWQDGTLHLVFSYVHAVGDYMDIALTNAHSLLD